MKQSIITVRRVTLESQLDIFHRLDAVCLQIAFHHSDVGHRPTTGVHLTVEIRGDHKSIDRHIIAGNNHIPFSGVFQKQHHTGPPEGILLHIAAHNAHAILVIQLFSLIHGRLLLTSRCRCGDFHLNGPPQILIGIGIIGRKTGGDIHDLYDPGSFQITIGKIHGFIGLFPRGHIGRKQRCAHHVAVDRQGITPKSIISLGIVFHKELESDAPNGVFRQFHCGDHQPILIQKHLLFHRRKSLFFLLFLFFLFLPGGVSALLILLGPILLNGFAGWGFTGTGGQSPDHTKGQKKSNPSFLHSVFPFSSFVTGCWGFFFHRITEIRKITAKIRHNPPQITRSSKIPWAVKPRSPARP